MPSTLSLSDNFSTLYLPDKNFFNNKKIILDVTYNPSLTPLLKFSQENECKIIQGATMLLLQGIEQSSAFTRIVPNVKEIQEKMNKIGKVDWIDNYSKLNINKI